MNGPTLEELRGRVFKHSGGGAEGGHWLARRWARPAAVYGTWVAVRLRLGADLLTLFALLAYLSGAIAMGAGSRAWFAAGVALIWLGYWIDHVDGQVARWRREASVSGTYFDYIMHHVANLTIGFALGFGIDQAGGGRIWTPMGFLLGLSLLVLSLHDDCRYKAFFQRLKRTRSAFCVLAASGANVPAPRSQRGPLAALVRLMQRACEHPNVLTQLAVLAWAGLAGRTVWLTAIQLYVATMSAVAFILAVARVGRAVVERAPDAEFAQWFSMDDAPEPWSEAA